MAAIEVEHLSKVFHTNPKEPGLGGAVKGLFWPRRVDKTAVDAISFAIESGEVVGYIGVNGAGKSTTIKMLTGVLVPSGGHGARLRARPARASAWPTPATSAWSSASAPSCGGTWR